MNVAAQRILKSFDRLPERERAEVAAVIIRRTVRLDLPTISDDDLVLMAEELFLELDNDEI